MEEGDRRSGSHTHYPPPTLFCWSVDHDINCPVNFSGLRKNLRTESEIFGERRFSLFYTDWGTPARTNLSNLTIYNIVLLKELYWGQGAVLPAGSNIYFQACTIRFKCTQSYCHIVRDQMESRAGLIVPQS